MAKLARDLTEDPEGDVLALTANYRSTPRIVELSNKWNRTIPIPTSMTSPAMTPGRASRTDFDKSHVLTAQFEDRSHESRWIADAINTLVHKRKGALQDELCGQRGITYADIAVLVRTSTDARTYQTALRDVGIPAIVRAGPDLFAQPEVLLFAAAMALTVQRPSLFGWEMSPRTLHRRIQDELGVRPEAIPAIHAACARLSAEGLSVGKGVAERIIAASEAIGAALRRRGNER
jgi:DNA helicase-2/ATP-dependent DNA helicase PcrA